MRADGGALRRDPISCAVELGRFGAWQAAVAAVASMALAAVAAWAASTQSIDAVAVAAIAAALAAAVLVLAVPLARVEAGTLRSEGGAWSFQARAAAAPSPGELAIAVDFGTFMLLSFAFVGPEGRRERRWLPVQRRGLESSWHLLRCAVHAPRLARVVASE